MRDEDIKPALYQVLRGTSRVQRNLVFGIAAFTNGVNVSVVVTVPSKSNSAKFIVFIPQSGLES